VDPAGPHEDAGKGDGQDQCGEGGDRDTFADPPGRAAFS
jgi:hypothetical protein